MLCLDPIQIQMPALSPTMVEGTITKWLIAEGLGCVFIYTALRCSCFFRKLPFLLIQ